MENLSFEDVFQMEKCIEPSLQRVYLFPKSVYQRTLQYENSTEKVWETRFGCFGDFITGWDKVQNITVANDSLIGIPTIPILYFVKGVTRKETETFCDNVHMVEQYTTSTGKTNGQLLYGNANVEYVVKNIKTFEIIVISTNFLPPSQPICLTFEGIIDRMKYTFHSKSIVKNNIASDWKAATSK